MCFYIDEFGLYMVLCSIARGYFPFKFWSSMMQRWTLMQGISNLLKAPVIFSHNDLLSGNLMYNDTDGSFFNIPYGEQLFWLFLVCYTDNIINLWSCFLFLFSEKMILIDFEYSSYSYRGYDIGNHFAEYAGFECDYSL